MIQRGLQSAQLMKFIMRTPRHTSAAWVGFFFAASLSFPVDAIIIRNGPKDAARPCASREIGESVVCVCNSTYCDDLPTITPPTYGRRGTAQGTNYYVYQSTKSGKRFEASQGTFSPSSDNIDKEDAEVTYVVNPSGPENDRQSILGFGGAFTDAASINILNISNDAQDNLLKSYFADNGAQYSMGRVPMAGCDFSTHVYTYDDFDGDLSLSKFALADEDLKYKIPLLQRAQAFSSAPIKVFGSPWSAPAWMKEQGAFVGTSHLKGHPGGPYFKAWAQYFVLFIQAYEAQNVSIWGLTGQNEPTDGYVPKFTFNAMGWSPQMQRDFIKMDLGPALEAAGLRRVKLMIMDDQRFLLPSWANTVLNDEDANQYVDGVAVHWYWDDVVSASVLSETHKLHPDKFILSTEACEGWAPWEKKVELGSWRRAETYATDVFENLQNWVTGWIDWNIALNPTGGPNWANNFVDSPIIINSTADEFYKQPMFYSLAHFSKFLPPASTVISGKLSSVGAKEFPVTEEETSNFSSSKGKGLNIISAQRPDGGIAVVILNTNEKDISLLLDDKRMNRGYLQINIPAKSIQSLVWW